MKQHGELLARAQDIAKLEYCAWARAKEMLRELLDAFDMPDGPHDEAYRDAAKALHGSDGHCEIDEGAVVSEGEDDGAYIQAWVWVSHEDAGIGEEDDDA